MKKFAIILILALLAAWYFWPSAEPTDKGKPGTEAKAGKPGKEGKWGKRGGPGKRTAKVVREEIAQVVEESGEVLPEISTEVKSEVSGRIVEILVEEGARVTREQPLLRLDTTKLEAELEQAKRQHEAATLRLEKAKRHHQRTLALEAKDFARQQEREDSATDLRLAEIELEIQQARLATAEDNYSKATVTAPHDGIIIEHEITEGQVITGASSVNNGTVLLKVAELDKLLVETSFNEIDINEMEVDDELEIRFDAIRDEQFQGRITQIAASARKENNIRNFPVTVRMLTADKRIRPGITATVSFTVGVSENALVVPVSSVFFESGAAFVYQDKGDGFFERRDVKTGLSSTQMIEILEGIEEGATVSLMRPDDDGRLPEKQP